MFEPGVWTGYPEGTAGYQDPSIQGRGVQRDGAVMLRSEAATESSRQGVVVEREHRVAASRVVTEGAGDAGQGMVEKRRWLITEMQ